MFMKKKFKDNEVYGPYILPEVKVTPSKQDKANLVARRVNQGINEIGYKYVSPIVSELVPGGAAMDWLISKGVKKVANKISPEIINMLLTGDKYTTPGARFGYYGNPAERVYGTISRRLNLPDKPRKPELLRKLDIPIEIDENNNLIITGKDKNPHSITNFTTDRPVVSHSRINNWDHADLYIFDPNITKGAKPISIEPSDTFYVGKTITAIPSQTTLVSGNINLLKDAQNKGISTLSSRRARRLYNRIDQEYQKVLDEYMFDDDPEFRGSIIKRSVDSSLRLKYAKELQRLQSKRGTPRIQDYMNLEKETGLKAGVAPIQARQRFISTPPTEGGSSIIEQLYNIESSSIESPVFLPNNRKISTEGEFNRTVNLIKRQPYNKLFYDPATHSENDWLIKNGLNRRNNIE